MLARNSFTISNMFHECSSAFSELANPQHCPCLFPSIEVDNLEIPILDGSAEVFAEMIEKAGVIRQPLARLGAEAANLTIDLIEDPAGRHAGRRFPVELVVRGSTSRPSRCAPVGRENGIERRVP